MLLIVACEAKLPSQDLAVAGARRPSELFQGLPLFALVVIESEHHVCSFAKIEGKVELTPSVRFFTMGKLG